MKKVIKFFAEPLYVGTLFGSIFVAMIIFMGDKSIGVAELIFFGAVMVTYFAFPFLILSNIARKRLHQPKKLNRLVGMWIGAIVATGIYLAMNIAYEMHPTGGANLGYVLFPFVTLFGGWFGYMLVWTAQLISSAIKPKTDK